MYVGGPARKSSAPSVHARTRMFIRADGASRANSTRAWSPSCCVSRHTLGPQLLISEPDDEVSRQAVLIISSDPLAAALLGAAVELAGHQPHFVRTEERARAALLRARPRLVLVDCDHDEA